MPLPAALSDQISPPLGIRTTPKAFIFPRSTRADRSGGLCEGNLPACSPLCGPAHCLERESWPAASLVGRARRGRGEMGQDVARALKSMQAKLPASVLARPLPEDGRCVTIRVQAGTARSIPAGTWPCCPFDRVRDARARPAPQELRNLQTKAFSVHLRFIDPRTDKPHQIQAYRALSVVVRDTPCPRAECGFAIARVSSLHTPISTVLFRSHAFLALPGAWHRRAGRHAGALPACRAAAPSCFCGSGSLAPLTA